jgi:chromo domain-containing protein 1
VQLYNLLSDCNYVEHDQDASEPYIRRPDDYWPIISERKIVSDAYYEALESSQAQANDEQISLYAGTVVELRHMYRQYFIVHTEPSKVNWKSRWLHLDEVLTPEKCIEYLEQPSAKGNRIDFQSWRFPAKSTQPTAAASSETPGMKDMSVDRSDGAGSPMVISESDLRPSPQILH